VSTPNYVKEAVLAYLERGFKGPLAQMFENGIPLHTYPESRKIVAQLIRGEPVKPKGRPTLSRGEKARRYSVLVMVAQLHGAGLGVYSGGATKTKETACDIVARCYGFKSGKHVYDEIWTPKKDSEDVKMHIEIGRNNPQFLTLFDVD
jgi:hypothetical protein